MDINDTIIVRMPLQATTVKWQSSLRQYHNRIGKIIAIEKGGYRITTDDGKYLWPPFLLGKVIAYDETIPN